MSALLTVKEELENMNRAISRGDGNGIAAALSRLDSIIRTEGERLPPRLRHFLERRSYEKALAFLREDSGPEEGDSRL